MTDLDIDEFKRELLIASDVRSFIELLQHAFDEEREKRGLTKSRLAEDVGRDLSYVSRVINGRQRNVTLHTAALFMRAMGRRLGAHESRLADLEARKSNFHILPGLTEAPKTNAVWMGEAAKELDDLSKGARTSSPSSASFSLAR